MKLFDDQKVGIVYSNYYSYNEENNKKKLIFKKKLPSGLISGSLLQHYTVGIITTIIRKSLLSELNSPFNSKYNIIGDFDLIIKLSLNNKFACIQAPLAYYRIHQTNYSSINYESEIEELEDWLKNQVIFDKSKFENLLKNIKLKILYMQTINYILNGNLKNAIKNIFFFPLGIKKIKLITTLFLTKKMLKKIKKFN